MATRDAFGEMRRQQADDASADDEDLVAGSSARVPMGVEGGFHIGGKRGPLRGYGVRKWNKHRFGGVKIILVWMQAKDLLAYQFIRTRNHNACRRIAVFDGEGKLTRLHRRAHAGTFALRDLTKRDEAFCATAQSAKARFDARFSGSWRGEALGSQFRDAGLDVPECTGHHQMAGASALCRCQLRVHERPRNAFENLISAT